MGGIKRIWSVISGLLLIALSILMLLVPELGYDLLILFLEFTLIIAGARRIIHYFTMARFMVGGTMTLYLGILLVDFGLFLLNLDDLPKMWVLLYLATMLMISGIIDVLRANEARKMESGNYKYQMFIGLVKCVFAGLSGLFYQHLIVMTIMYVIGMVHSGISRIITAFRRTAVVYIE